MALRKNWLWYVAVSLSVACGQDQLGLDGGSGDDSSDSGPLPESLTKRIGPAGGQLKVQNVVLDIPAGALSDDTEITVSNLGTKAGAALPGVAKNLEPVGGPTAFQPHGLKFKLPVSVKMTTTAPRGKVVVQKLDDDQDQTWSEVTAVAKLPDMTFKTTSFSIYSAYLDTGTSGTGGAPSAGGSSSVGGSTAGNTSGGAPLGGEVSLAGAVGTGGEPSGGGGSVSSVGGKSGAGGSGAVRPAGYFENADWRGYWFVSGYNPANVTTDVTTFNAAPFCADVSTGLAETAGIGFYLNQVSYPLDSAIGTWSGGQADGGVEVLLDGASSGTVFKVRLVDASGLEWCSTGYAESLANQARLGLRWDSFYSCAEAVEPLDIGANPPMSLAVEVLEYFSGTFCIEGIAPVASLPIPQ